MLNPDLPGPECAEAFADAMLNAARDRLAGTPLATAPNRLGQIATLFEQGLIEDFRFTSEEANATAKSFLVRALDEWRVYAKDAILAGDAKGNA